MTEAKLDAILAEQKRTGEILVRVDERTNQTAAISRDNSERITETQIDVAAIRARVEGAEQRMDRSDRRAEKRGGLAGAGGGGVVAGLIEAAKRLFGNGA